MTPYDVLDPLSPLYGKIFIEASAGTGKTFAIEHMVLRLILDGMDITQILVVTFTKAGALDLKRRIHSSLLKMGENLRNNDLSTPYLQSIKNKEEALLLIENGCVLSSEMPIYTIHSFAFQMLSTFAFEAGSDLELLDFNDDKHKDLTFLAILDTLRGLTSEEVISAGQLFRLMDSDRKITTFTKKITSYIQNHKALSLPPTFSELKKDFLTLLEETELETLEEHFEELAPLFKGCMSNKKQIHSHLFDQLHHLKKKDFDSLIGAKDSLIELLQAENIKKGKQIPYNNPLFSLCQKLSPILSTAKDPTSPLSHIAIKAKKRLENQSVKDPDGILYSLLEGLKKPSLKKKIQALFSATIIDEFQDTDPIQWEILKTLFFDTAQTFCTVGDPKQSIYAFRGADLPTYLVAKQSFSHHFSLDTNFRSKKSLVEGLNLLFSEKTTPGFLSFEEHSQDLRYYEVKAGKKQEGPSTLSLCLALPKKEGGLKASLADIEEEIFFPHIANTLQTLNLPLDQIAILVKDRYQGLSLCSYLQKMNIPTKATFSSSLLKSPFFSLFEILLFLTYSPRSESLIKELLSHSFINAPIDLIKEDLSNPLLQQLSIDFSLLKQILEEEGLCAYLYALMDKKLFADRSLGELLCHNESSFLTMMQIFSLFLQHFDTDPRQFISEIQKLDPDTFSFLKKGTGTDKKSVTIMTSHLSKGLEFEAVFAISLYTRMKQSVESREKAISLDKEKMRLLYVTLTRAKSHLYIYGTLFGSIFPVDIGGASPLELFLSRVQAPFLSYEALYEKILTLNCNDVLLTSPISAGILFEGVATKWETKEDLIKIYPPEEAKTYQKPPRSFSFSSLSFEEGEIVPVKAQADFPYGSKVGNQIHLFLEKIIEEGLYTPFSGDTLLPILKKSFFQTPLEGFEESIFEKLKEIFTTSLKSPYGSFTLESIPPHQMWQEVLFQYKLENSPCEMKGFADVIVLHNERFYIVDWKCNHLEGYHPQEILKALEKHHYTTQASIYTRALKGFLEAKNLSFKDYFGGAFYIFIRGGKEGITYFSPEPLPDKEIVCLQ